MTQADTIHLTLAFLGEVEERFVPNLRSLSVTGERHSLPIEEARYWPHNRIVWAGPHEIPEQLGLLAGNLRKELVARDFKAEKRPFAAHITLIRKARDPGLLAPVPSVNWPVEEIVLVRSQLAAAGPRYEVLERFALRGS